MPPSATDRSSGEKAGGSPKDHLAPMPVIVGAPRSGTTMLRLMLDAHPQLSIPPETGFLALASALKSSEQSLHADLFLDAITNFPREMPTWPDFGIAAEDLRDELNRIQLVSAADGFRAFYRLYAERSGKSRWGDKTPEYVLHISDIAETLPEAHFIHIIRDGRDVGLSLRQCWFAPDRDMKGLAGHWQQRVTEGRRQGAGCCHYIEVRYETLVRRPPAVLAEICGFLGLPYVGQLERYHERSMDRLREHGERRTRDGLLVVSREERLRQQQLVSRPPDPSRIEAWKETMTTDERRDFEEVAGELLRDLGYEM
jgi:Sulfotransferase family